MKSGLATGCFDVTDVPMPAEVLRAPGRLSIWVRDVVALRPPAKSAPAKSANVCSPSVERASSVSAKIEGAGCEESRMPGLSGAIALARDRLSVAAVARPRSANWAHMIA